MMSEYQQEYIENEKYVFDQQSGTVSVYISIFLPLWTSNTDKNTYENTGMTVLLLSLKPVSQIAVVLQ